MLLLNVIYPNNSLINILLSIIIIMLIFINVNPYYKKENKLSILEYIPKNIFLNLKC